MEMNYFLRKYFTGKYCYNESVPHRAAIQKNYAHILIKFIF